MDNNWYQIGIILRQTGRKWANIEVNKIFAGSKLIHIVAKNGSHFEAAWRGDQNNT